MKSREMRSVDVRSGEVGVILQPLVLLRADCGDGGERRMRMSGVMKPGSKGSVSSLPRILPQPLNPRQGGRLQDSGASLPGFVNRLAAEGGPDADGGGLAPLNRTYTVRKGDSLSLSAEASRAPSSQLGKRSGSLGALNGRSSSGDSRWSDRLPRLTPKQKAGSASCMAQVHVSRSQIELQKYKDRLDTY